MGWKGLLVVPLLAAAACGGGGASGSSGDRPHPPHIPTAIAASLATRADAIAAQIDAGNGCAARQEVSRLRAAVSSGADADRIPPRLRVQLQSAVASLSSRIVCIPPKPPAPRPKPHHEDHHHHHEKHKHGEGD